MKLKFTYRGPKTGLKKEYSRVYTSDADLDDVGGYLMDDIRSLAQNESITITKEEI